MMRFPPSSSGSSSPPIYANAEAGKRLQDMMAMGASRPWPDALEALTGQRSMDASAMAEYFARSSSGWTSRIEVRKSDGDSRME